MKKCKYIVLTNNRVKSLNSGPIGKYVNSFIELLVKQGFSTEYIPKRLGIIADLNRWIVNKKLKVSNLDSKKVLDFMSDHNSRFESVDRGVHRATLNLFINFLQEKGMIQKPKILVMLNAKDKILFKFDEHLDKQKGLSKSTRIYYRRYIRMFLLEIFGSKKIDFRKLNAKYVLYFIRKLSEAISPKQSQLVTTALRSFFQYIRLIGKINIDLSNYVPTVANKSGENIPEILSQKEVNKLLMACNQNNPMGIRDYAILLLLSRLGLRSCEIIQLTLDDIDWDRGTISIQRKGTKQDQLPIDRDIGKAIIRYLKCGRPAYQGRQLFLSVMPPLRGIGSSATVGTIVKTALERAGLNTRNKGAHLLRHTAATRILRNGATLSEVGNILGHQSHQTTAIYAKVDFKKLNALAQPWPCSINGGVV